MPQMESALPRVDHALTPLAGARETGWSRGGVALLLCALVVGAGVLASALLGRVAPPVLQAARAAEAAKAAEDARHAAQDAAGVVWPFVVLFLSVGLVITLITVVRLHAFLSLILAAIAAGLMARVGTLPGEADQSHWAQAVELTTVQFGLMCTKVGLVIALAAVIGTCLLESGAADKIVRRFLAVFGEKQAAFALLAGTYVVSIPIFFDTIFMLLVPLAKALRLRTGKDYVLYMLAICCSAAVTHSMVIPHPGPAAMASSLHLDEGFTIVFGWATGTLPVLAGWFVCRWINRRVDVPLVETPGAALEDLRALMDKPESELPSLPASLTPVVLPVLLIASASFLAPLKKGHPGTAALIDFLGNRHVALLISLAVAVQVLRRQRNLSLRQVGELIGPTLELAGIMILITAAGGAFGLMLEKAGVADAIAAVARGKNLNLILLSWTVALVIRVAQGSATVAMLVTAGMMYPLTVASAGHPGLPYHPVYIFLAIGYGALGISWMNDGGFWVVSKLGGMTERQTLRTWTVMVGCVSFAGLLTTLLLSFLLPDYGASLTVHPGRRSQTPAATRSGSEPPGCRRSPGARKALIKLCLTCPQFGSAAFKIDRPSHPARPSSSRCEEGTRSSQPFLSGPMSIQTAAPFYGVQHVLRGRWRRHMSQMFQMPQMSQMPHENKFMGNYQILAKRPSASVPIRCPPVFSLVLQ